MPNIPKNVFIVPYKNRPQHKYFFSNYLNIIMDDRDDYEIYFSHQCDNRSFNRGGTKNIGFLAVKAKYPNDYKNINFIFNDIDTIPFADIFDYETVPGTVNHFYGFKFALGGIVSFKGADFESVNGYPNFWGWGQEDNALQTRCQRKKMIIDRSQFYPIGDPNIIQLFDGVSRIINRNEQLRGKNDNGIEGLRTIHKLEYTIDTESMNPLDNIHTIISDRIFIINITTFMTGNIYDQSTLYKYDLREPSKKILRPDKKTDINVVEFVNNWTNIPFYPTTEIKNEMIQKYGKQRATTLIEDMYKKSMEPTTLLVPSSSSSPSSSPSLPSSSPSLPSSSSSRPSSSINLSNRINLLNQYQNKLLELQKYNESLLQSKPNKIIVKQNINNYAPEYSRVIHAKPNPSASVNIRLGGLYPH